LEQRIETQLSILTEIQEYFRRRADVELDYAKNLDNLHKQIGQKHRAQKARFVFFFKKSNSFSKLHFLTDEKLGSFNRSINYGILSFKILVLMLNIIPSCLMYAENICMINLTKLLMILGECL
jgi:hypothetical protein